MYLPSPIPWHDLISIIHHSIVDGLAVVFNILLLLAVIFRSPMSLKSYTVLLMNSAIIDLLSSFTMLMVMVRVVPARTALAYVYDGPCVFVSGMFCHSLFTVMLATLSQSLFLIACSFGYRLYVLGRPTPSNKAVALVCLVVSAPNLMILTTYMFALDDVDAVRAQMNALRPAYGLDEYVLGGHVSILNPFALFTILAMTLPITPTLVLIFFLRKKMLSKLVAHSVQMSGRTAQMHNTLSRVLTLQSLLPVFFSVATASYAVCQFDIYCSPYQEHLSTEAIAFMALFSPMIPLYCMKSYKEFVISLARCDISTLRTSLMEPSTTRTADMHKEQISVI